MKKRIKIRVYAAIAGIASLAMGGCIKNDIPYPRIQPNIVALTVADQLQPAQIDTVNRIATVFLTEEADIYNVEVKECILSQGASFVGAPIEGYLDLSQPNTFVLKVYYDYEWTIAAVQNIERYFRVANQIGLSEIDDETHTVVVTLPYTASLSSVKIEAAKLGSPSAVMNPDVDGLTVDLTEPLVVEVSDHGRTTEWTVRAVQSEATVTTVRVDAWTNVAWVYGEAQAGRDNSVEYRRVDSSTWVRVPDEWITADGGNFHARLIHLEPLTEYVARAVSGDDKGNEITFKTGVVLQMPNSDFENWWLDGRVWCPWAEDGVRYWDTGNRGAATLGQSNTVPTEDTPTGQGRAAKLETRFVGIGMLGKLAAGNIFVGEYVRTDGTNGVLSFGREFEQRPTRLSGYFQYTPVPITHTASGFESMKNEPDTCIIWAALIDSANPFEIRTNPNNRQLFDPDGEEVIAYGKMESGRATDGYQPFVVDLEYKATDRKPRYIIVVASASKYGDYFTGGNGSILLVDDFNLEYDY